MSGSNLKRYVPSGIFLTIIVLVSILVAGTALWHYNIFVFKRAADQMPPQYRVHIERYTVELVKFFPFSQENALKEWEEKIFKGKVIYKVEKEDPLSYVKASSAAAASALYYKIRLEAGDKHPVISWKWNVEKFPSKTKPENIESEDENDFAARVYVIFPSMFLLNSKVLEYIWAETVPAGTVGTNPFSKNIKIIVARSGLNKNKEWFFEERDIIEDYMKAFGGKPEHDIGAVAFMTNTEHTGSDAVSMYPDIKLGYREDKPKGGEASDGKKTPQEKVLV